MGINIEHVSAFIGIFEDLHTDSSNLKMHARSLSINFEENEFLAQNTSVII